MDIKRIEEALRLHINYKGIAGGDKYLKMMDSMSYMYSGAPGIRLSKLLDDYYKEVGVSNLDEALTRLRRIEDNELKQHIVMKEYDELFIEQLKRQLFAYVTIGNGGSENPMWLQFAGVSDDEEFLKFESSQNRNIWFNIPVQQKHVIYFAGDYTKYYEYFRELKYNYIAENFPTVYTQIKSLPKTK